MAEVSETQKSLTPDELKAMWDALPPEFKQGVTDLNAEIIQHNKGVEKVKASESKDPKHIRSEVRTDNPSGNKKITRINEQINKLQEQIEKLISEADKVIDDEGLMPAEASEEEIAKLRETIKDTSKTLREKASGVTQIENFMPNLKGKISPHIVEIKTLRGVAKSGGNKPGGGEGIRRLRFKQIMVNDVVEKDGDTVYSKVKNAKTGEHEEKYTFSFTAQFLNKQSRDLNVTASELQEYYAKALESAEGNFSLDNRPSDFTFVYPHTFKANDGSEQTIEYKIRAIV